TTAVNTLALHDALPISKTGTHGNDAVVGIQRDLERRTHGGNVLVKTLGQLVTTEMIIRGQLRYPQTCDVFASTPILFAISDVIIDRKSTRLNSSHASIS